MERRISLLHYLSLHPLDSSHRWLFALFLTVYGCLIGINPKGDIHLMGRVMSYMSRMSSSYTLTFMKIYVHWNFCSVKLSNCLAILTGICILDSGGLAL